MARKPPADLSMFQDEHPESFENEEFTTKEVLEMGKGEDEEAQRVVDRSRRSQRDVQKVQRPQRGHVTPARQAARAQRAERENPIVWKPVESLDAPPAPPGMVMRWIRFKVGDKPDAKNLSKKFRTGWKPYLKKDAPDDFNPVETYKAEFGEVIACGDLMLCIMPRALFQARKRYFAKLAAQQKDAIKAKVDRISNPEAPLGVYDRETFSRGRRPQVQDDQYGEG